jgi:hypothetical protein
MDLGMSVIRTYPGNQRDGCIIWGGSEAFVGDELVEIGLKRREKKERGVGILPLLTPKP